MNTAWKITCIALAILLVGMSALFFVWNGKLSSANAQVDDLNVQVESLTSQNTTLQTNLTSTQSQLSSANAQVTSLTSQNATLQTDLEQAQGQVTSLTAQNSTLSAQNDTLTAQNAMLTGQNASLSSQLSDAESELDALNSVYPLQFFSSSAVITSWFNSIKNQIDYDQYPVDECLQIQELAMQDGYYLNVVIDLSAMTVAMQVWTTSGHCYYLYDDGTIEMIF